MNRSFPHLNIARQALWTSALLLIALVLAACAPAATAVPTDTAVPPTAVVPTIAPTAVIPVTGPTAAPAAAEASISVATDPKYGKILVDAKGMTLYMFTKDDPGKSNCSGGCLKAWPPLLTQGNPTLGDGVDPSLVGTADMADGTKIVTYNKIPLYYWASDQKPGDITGLGVGGVWFLVSPLGKAVGVEASISVGTDAKYGKILTDSKGMTLYMYTKDTPGKSNCAGGCLKAWPPLLTSGSPKLGDGVDASLVGSADLPDGSKIVTYNQMPLYYFAKDTKPGDITGLGVGGVWFLVSADGKIVGKDAAINIATDPKYGKILVDSKGMALYVYTKDTPGKSNCTAGCAAAWPPLLTSGNPILGAGVNAAMIGSADLADGTKIVTYNQMPLYYFAKDAKPGDVTGEGVGGVWFLLGPDGKLIQSASSGTGY